MAARLQCIFQIFYNYNKKFSYRWQTMQFICTICDDEASGGTLKHVPLISNMPNLIAVGQTVRGVCLYTINHRHRRPHKPAIFQYHPHE